MSSAIARSQFTEERLRRIGQLEGWHFWFAGRRELLQRLLGRYLPTGRVVDVGCGSGSLVEALAQGGRQVVGLDVRPEGLRDLRARAGAARLLQADAAALPLRDRTVDAIVMLDVLEHLDDRQALDEARRALRPGGVVVLTVPAVPWLWSYRDAAAGHRRRYTRRTLRRALEGAGLVVLDLRHYQCLLFPLLAAARLLGRRGPAMRDREEAPGPLNRVFSWVNRWEARASDHIRWPWGSSLVAVCRRV